MNTSRSKRSIRNTVNYCQTTYKIQPWGQSSWQLPIIIRNSKERKSALNKNEDKKQSKLSIYHSAQKLKMTGHQSSLNRQTPAHSLSYAKKPTNPKYNQNFYRAKSIKIIDLMKSQDIKKKVKRKLSKKILFGKSNNNNNNSSPHSQLPELSPSRFSSHHDPVTCKAEKRLEIERKIFMILSRDRI